MNVQKDERMFPVKRKQTGIADLNDEQAGVYELSDEQLALVHGGNGVDLNLNPCDLVLLPKKGPALP